MDEDELRDYLDQDPDIPSTSTADLGPYAGFLQSIPDYSDMSEAEFTRAVDALSLSRPGLACGARLQIPVQDFKEI